MRGSKALIAVAIVLLGGAQIVSSEESGDPADRADRFLSQVEAGEVATALERLAVGSPLIEGNSQALTLLKGQIDAAFPVYGKALGHELVHSESFGRSILRLVYVQRLELHPLVWEFYFYRPAERWVLAKVLFQDQFELLRAMGQ